MPAGRRSKKLEYVDELMAEIAGKRPLLTHRERVDPLASSTERSANITGKSRRSTWSIRQKTYDRDLRRLVLGRSEKSPLGSGLVIPSGRNRATVRELVAKWTGDIMLLDAVLGRHDATLPLAGACARSAGAQKLILEFTDAVDRANPCTPLFGPSRRRWIAAMKALRVPGARSPDWCPRIRARGTASRKINVWKNRIDVVTHAAAQPATKCARSASMTLEADPRTTSKAWKPDVVLRF